MKFKKENDVTEPENHDDAKTFSEDYVKTLREENARRRLAEKNVKEELARVRDALGVQDDASVDLADACEQLRTRSEADRQLATDALIRVEFAQIANDLDLVDADAAFRLADTSAVRVDPGTRKVEGLREVLDALVREKPYLVGRATRAGSPGGGTPRSGARQDDDSLGGRIRKQFQKRLPSGMTVPGGDLGNLRITR